MNYGKKGVRQKQKALNSKSMKWGKKIILTLVKVVLIGVISVGIVGAAAGIGVYRGIIDTAPDIGPDDVAPVGYSSFVYDAEGNQIGKLVTSNSNRIPVTMENIPQDLADAFVALEDERFYTNNGVDFKGMLRSAYWWLKTGGEETQGGSTITQQLLKNTVFTNWMSESGWAEKFKRKFQEQYLAIELTKMLSKEEILERYMNTINLGQNTLGVQAASLRYFNKPVNELTLSECAVIASITQSPTRLNPISHPENNADRRKKCLTNMLEQGYITQAEYDEAMADNVYERIEFTNIEFENSATTSYYVDAVTDAVYQDLLAAGYSESNATFLLYSGGLRIHTPMDPHIQAIADDVMSNPENFPENVKWYLTYELSVETAAGETVNYSKEMMKKYFQENIDKKFNLIFNSTEEANEAVETYKAAILQEGDTVIGEKINLTVQPQVTLTVEDQSTGYIVAIIGGRGTKTGSRTLNRAVSSYRQPGSTFKILSTYAPALDSAGLTLATVLNDAPFNYEDGTPVSNWWDGEPYRGLNSFRTGITNSMNVLTVKALTLITPKLGYDYLLNFGFTSLVEGEYVNDEWKTDIIQSQALGGITRGVSNLELNAAYAAIANGGTYIKPKFYTKVYNSQGELILDNTEPVSHQVIKETTAYLLTDAMMDVVTVGTGKVVNFSKEANGMAIAGKTGTTSDYNDIWFCGYTPYYTATVWVGYDNNVKLNKTEQGLAKKLWRAVMAEIHKDLPGNSFPVPEGIVTAQVCSRSGKLPIAGLCDNHIRTEIFAEGTVPTEYCDVHYQGYVCQYSHLMACETCPFAALGTLELLPIEPPELQSGSTVIVENPDGTVSVTTPQTSNMCPHNAEFFTNPNCYSIIEQQRQEIANRALPPAPPAETQPFQ